MTGPLRGVSITQRLLALTLIALMPAAAVVGYYNLALYQQREREVHGLALEYAQLTSLEMERIVAGVEGMLQVLGNTPVVMSFDRPACNQLLRDVNEELPQLLAIAITDAEGLVRCSVPVVEGEHRLNDRSFFAEAMERGSFVVGEFERSRTQDTGSIALVLPIRNGAGADQIIGTVVTGFDLTWLGEQLRTRTLVEGSSLTIADRNGVIVAREPFPEQFVGTRIPDEFQQFVRARQPGSLEVMSQDGTRRILGYYPPAYTGTGLYVSYGLSRDMAFAPVLAATYYSIAIAVAGGIAVILITWLVGDRLFRRPIERLLTTIRAWRQGDDTARTGIRSGQGELARLAGAIDEYMNELVADRAARSRVEQHRDLLVREIDHRVKNMLATVQAVATQTFRASENEDAQKAFAERLASMAAAHDMLTAESWRNADLRRTLEVGIRPFEGEASRRFVLEGPPVPIRARAALSLSMAIHELCTNAVKYGALSKDGGSVAITWSIESKPEGSLFLLEWRESGGPLVVVPERKGFGSVMIERALAAELSADVVIAFDRAGLVCTVRFALASLAPEEDEVISEPT